MVVSPLVILHAITIVILHFNINIAAEQIYVVGLVAAVVVHNITCS